MWLPIHLSLGIWSAEAVVEGTQCSLRNVTEHSANLLSATSTLLLWKLQRLIISTLKTVTTLGENLSPRGA